MYSIQYSTIECTMHLSVSLLGVGCSQYTIEGLKYNCSAHNICNVVCTQPCIAYFAIYCQLNNVVCVVQFVEFLAMCCALYNKLYIQQCVLLFIMCYAPCCNMHSVMCCAHFNAIFNILFTNKYFANFLMCGILC